MKPQNPKLTAQLRSIFGDTAVDAVREMRCVNPPMGCGGEITGFRDDLSEREWQLVGMCQACQDEFEQSCREMEDEEML